MAQNVDVEGLGSLAPGTQSVWLIGRPRFRQLCVMLVQTPFFLYSVPKVPSVERPKTEDLASFFTGVGAAGPSAAAVSVPAHFLICLNSFIDLVF